jgi:exodeoxyribonuclease VII small subunit
MANKTNKEVQPDYREAIERIEVILQELENEAIDVDSLNGKVAEAIKLINLCKAKLKSTEENLKNTLDSLDSE